MRPLPNYFGHLYVRSDSDKDVPRLVFLLSLRFESVHADSDVIPVASATDTA